MSLTQNTMLLIRAISENNMSAARKLAIACLEEDTTLKNKAFTQKYIPVLKKKTELIALPDNIKNKVEALDVSESFRTDRYLLTEENKKIIDNIIRMQKVSQQLAAMQIPYVNATLLYGESGTGKTTLAKYAAHKLKLPYVFVNFSQTIDSKMGSTSSTLNLIFNYVKSHPCVFVLDELDAIAIRRSNSSDSGVDGEMNRITITLMQELDKLPNNVVLIATTNRLDRIDEALVNRFPQQKHVALPDNEQKNNIIKKYISSIPILDAQEIVTIKENIDISVLENQRDVINSVIEQIAEILYKKIGE